MADFELEPPSFSLGLDLDIESEPPPNSSTTQPTEQPPIEINEDEDFESPVRVSNHPPRVIERLRNGPTVQPKSDGPNGEADYERGKYDVYDDIEGFSSKEDCPRGTSFILLPL